MGASAQGCPAWEASCPAKSSQHQLHRAWSRRSVKTGFCIARYLLVLLIRIKSVFYFQRVYWNTSIYWMRHGGGHLLKHLLCPAHPCRHKERGRKYAYRLSKRFFDQFNHREGSAMEFYNWLYNLTPGCRHPTAWAGTTVSYQDTETSCRHLTSDSPHPSLTFKGLFQAKLLSDSMRLACLPAEAAGGRWDLSKQ